jgi:cytochrome c oxidase assembly protein subunit 15
MLENPSTVQLDHRILASTTLAAVVALWAYTRFLLKTRRLPKVVRSDVARVVHLVTVQVLLGIGTLVYLVPIPLAAAHQATALALLTSVLVLANRTSAPARSLKLIRSHIGRSANAGAKAAPLRASPSVARRSNLLQ